MPRGIRGATLSAFLRPPFCSPPDQRLASLEGFAALPNLRELDLSHNSVQDMLGLVSNVDLRVLRISHNRIRRIEGIHQLKRLEEVRSRLRTRVLP